jgi:hypothetical protein
MKCVEKFLVKLTSIKFHGNPFSHSRTDGWTDQATLTGALQGCERARNRPFKTF